jgi:hypothetical protein
MASAVRKEKTPTETSQVRIQFGRDISGYETDLSRRDIYC